MWPSTRSFVTKGGAESVRILVKQAVVADAEADYHIEIRFSAFSSLACRIGLHIFGPTSSQTASMPTEVLRWAPTLQPNPTTSNPWLRKMEAARGPL